MAWFNVVYYLRRYVNSATNTCPSFYLVQYNIYVSHSLKNPATSSVRLGVYTFLIVSDMCAHLFKPANEVYLHNALAFDMQFYVRLNVSIHNSLPSFD